MLFFLLNITPILRHKSLETHKFDPQNGWKQRHLWDSLQQKAHTHTHTRAPLELEFIKLVSEGFFLPLDFRPKKKQIMKIKKEVGRKILRKQHRHISVVGKNNWLEKNCLFSPKKETTEFQHHPSPQRFEKTLETHVCKPGSSNKSRKFQGSECMEANFYLL